MKKKKTIIIISIVTFAIFTFSFIIGVSMGVGLTTFLKSTVINGHSMSPNYQDGEYYMVSGIPYMFIDPKRGDVIMHKHGKYDFIQRIIAIPGDKISLKDGKVYINGDILEEPYLEEGTISNPDNLLQDEEITIGENEYYVMGDLRENSFDSRTFGTIKEDDIIGKVLFCYRNCK